MSSFFYHKEKKLEHVRWRCLTKYAAFSIPTNISSGASLESSLSMSSSYWVAFSSPSSFVSASVSSSGSSSELSLSNCVGKTNGSILSLASSPVSLMTPFGYEFIYITMLYSYHDDVRENDWYEEVLQEQLTLFSLGHPSQLFHPLQSRRLYT